MRMETIGGKILAVTIVVYLLWTGTASGETTTYKFDPDQSTVVRSFFTSDTYPLIGAFQLTVDANSGSFDWVDGAFSDDPNLQTGDLGELFYMGELVGDVVNDTTIEFGLPPGHPVLQSYDIHVTVTFQNDQVHLAGYRNPLMVGEPGYTLDAIANLFQLLYVDTVNGDDLNDGLSPETAFATIQKGIDTAEDGDTVIVFPGKYTENINFLGKNITLTSTKPISPNIVDGTIIDGSVCFRGTEGPSCTLTGFNIDSYIVGFDQLIDPNGENHTHATISYCILENFLTPCEAAIQACDGTISNCLIANIYPGCLVPWRVAQIKGCHGLIKNCTIADIPDGIEIMEGGTCTIENSILYHRAWIFVNSGATLNISYCDLQDGLNGIEGDGTVNWGPGNIDADPFFVLLGDSDTQGDYHLLQNSPCIDAGDPGYVPGLKETDLDGNSRILNGTVDMGAYEVTTYDLTVTVVSGHGTVEPISGSYSAGTVVTLTATPEVGYVVRQWTGTDDDTSCGLTNTVTMDSDKTVTVEFGQRHIFKVPVEYVTIQEAIDAAGCGDIVVLSAGVYFEDINFNGKNITVTSMNPDDPCVVALTVIQGTGAGPVVTFSGSESQSCKLDGITVTDGNTTGDGGGICGNGTEAMIANCIITGNHADGAGGGVSDCDGKITGCIIAGNTASGNGGGIYVVDCNVSVEDCNINHNAAADGGGLYCLDSPGATITRCTISDNDANGSGMTRGGGIFVFSSPILIEDCRISRNYAAHGGGIFNEYSSPTLTNCVFIGNSADGNGGGMYNSSNPRLTNCTFSGNSAGYYGGIWNYPPPPGDGGASSVGGSSNIVNNCILWGNIDSRGMDESAQIGTFGISLIINYSCVQGWTGSLGGVGNIGDNPLFMDVASGNYHLMAGSPCIDTGDNTAVPPTVLTDLDGRPRIVNGTVDMGAYEFQGIQILYVDADAPQFGDGTSWTRAFKHLQDALFNAIPPAEIRVAQGIYKPHLNSYSAQPPSRSDTFQLKNGVTIKGGYAGLGNPDPNARDFELYETILSGDLNGDDVEVDPVDLLDEPTRSENSYNVVTGTGCSRSAILEGFTITGGNANGTLLSDMSGGGIYDGDLTVISCKIVGNSAAGGGGVSCHGGSTLSDCTISGNAALSAGGGLSGVISVVNCTISDNLATHFSAQGGGISCRDTELVSGCTFINNSSRFGGGLATSYDLPTVVNCRFIGNSAHEGGGVYSGGFSPELIGCVFSGNTADDGGGLYAYEGFPRIVNCTFTYNYSPLGGGMNTPEGGPVVVNCVFWGNRAGEEIRDELAQLGVRAGGVTVDHSCVQGWTGILGGTGNIGDNPLFTDPNGADGVAGTEDDNLRLLHGSPCIDTGDNTAVPPSVLTDLDGNPRIIGGTVDMGAYEFYLLYVDDDGPNDPGPGDPQVSDPLEDGTEAHPFDDIQEAIDLSKDGYTVLVRQGSYSEPGTGNCIDFLGKNITLASIEPTDWDIVDNTVIRGYVQFSGTESPNCKFTGFKVSNLEGAIYGNHTHATISHCDISGNGPCGATVIKDCDGTIINCLITDNTTFFQCGVFPVVFGCNGFIKNCTIANNESGLSVGTATIENCIIYNNTGSQLAVTNGNTADISYSNVQNGLAGIAGNGQVNWGPGNIDTDPCFVRLGYWIMDEVMLVEGDYHLRSEGWRWNTEGKSWTYDFVTGRCVDAGNPASDLGDELMSVPRDPDNIWGVNLRINMGAFGGTDQASMPPHDWALLADLNNDGIVNFLDFAYQTLDLQATAPEQPGDQNRDGVVNEIDLAALAEKWLQVTLWCEY